MNPELTQDQASNMSLQELSVALTPDLTGKDLIEPPKQVDISDTFIQPKVNTTYKGIVENVSNNITKQEEQLVKQREQEKEAEQTYQALGLTSFGDMRAELNDQFGVTSNLKELQDINLQLTKMQEGSALTKSRIENAAGQTLGQAQREVTQEDREFAIRSAGLAARASVLQGNIDTARTLINDAMSDAYADRENRLMVAKDQLDRVREVADKEEQRLLDEKEKEYDLQLAQIQEVKDAVQQAVLSGASQQEIQQLTGNQLSDEEKLSLAQSITARGANEMRNLEIAQKQASIRSSNLSAQKTQKEIDAMNQLESGIENVAVQALDTFSGKLQENQREQFTTALSGAVKRGDVDSVERTLRNAAQAASDKEMTQQVIGRDAAIDALQDLKSDLQAYINAGGDTGILTGGYEQLSQKFGQTSDPELAKVAVKIRSSIQAYRKAISGAAFTESESKEYEYLFPSISNEQELNIAKTDALIDAFSLNNQSFYGNFYGNQTPSEIAEDAVIQELLSRASDEQRSQLEQ